MVESFLQENGLGGIFGVAGQFGTPLAWRMPNPNPTCIQIMFGLANPNMADPVKLCHNTVSFQ